MSRVLVFALACLAFGCSDSRPTEDAEIAVFEETDFSDATDADVLVVRAVFVEPAFGGDAALVDHEEIPGRMPAMRMEVALERPDLIADLVEGDKVVLTIREYETGPGFAVTAIEQLPDDTELNLEGTVSDSVFVPGL